MCRECHENEHGYKFDNNHKSKRKISSNKMKIINDAIYSGTKVTIKYNNTYKNEITIRPISPVELYKKNYTTKNGYNGSKWVVRAYCHLKNGERNFQIKNIKEIY